uniref:Uncharacterized protein n=1 Tax=Astyanax mexicanus TaxID=7994 RepID=A0A8B9I0H6_ASTMX
STQTRKIPKMCTEYRKPEAGLQWTLLAAVVKISEGASGQTVISSAPVQREVVALGTGTKCIGRAAMSCKGKHGQILPCR